MTWVSTRSLGDDSKRKITKLDNDYMCSCTFTIWLMKIPGVRVKDPSANCYSTKIFDKRIFTTQMYDNKTIHFVNV